MTFINSDPNVIRLFLAWLTLVGVEKERLTLRVYIHESADVDAAVRSWQEITEISADQFSKTVLKRHNPKTVRKNVGETYRGCLAIRVRKSAELYRRIEGWWRGMADAVG